MAAAVVAKKLEEPSGPESGKGGDVLSVAQFLNHESLNLDSTPSKTLGSTHHHSDKQPARPTGPTHRERINTENRVNTK